MSVWDCYEERICTTGSTKRDRALKRTQEYIARKVKDSLSFYSVMINGVSQGLTITDTTEDMAVKKIFSLPGEDIAHGGIVEFASSHWLITEINPNNEVYTEGRMHRCNYLLKWIDDSGKVIEKWCVVEDGTKYLIGEKSSDLMSIGDARIAITLAKDEDTNKLNRGKRFLVDDLDSDRVLAYQITKPNKLYNVYNGNGVFRFILNEVNLTDDDNIELRIADFFNWSKPNHDNGHKDKDKTLEEIIESATNKKDATEEGRWI